MRDVKNGIEIISVRERLPQAIHVVIPQGGSRDHLEIRLWEFLQTTSWQPGDTFSWPEPKNPEEADFEISRWEGDGGSPETIKVPYGSWLVLHKGKVKVVSDWDFKDRYEVAV